MLQEQLKDFYEPDFLQEIVNTAMYLSLYYVKPWYTASFLFDAPRNDLMLFKSLNSDFSHIQNTRGPYPKGFLEMTEMFLNKLCRHLDYCSERLAPLALFSDATTL